MSINRGVDKEYVVHIYNGVLLSHEKNGIGSFVEMWMDLETVIQSEVSQKEKKKLHILTHVESEKISKDALTYKAEIETQL